MEFQKILSQTSMDDFLSSIYWEHAFFREIYILSPSYFSLDGSRHENPESLVNIAILIITYDKNYPAIELEVEQAEGITIPFNTDLKPHGIVHRDGIELYFNQYNSVRAKSMAFRILGSEVFGDKIRYGKYWDELINLTP
jgi:hypothetical protein